jgi:signal transduction histidine kinase
MQLVIYQFDGKSGALAATHGPFPNEPGESVSIGRDESSRIRLDDRSVSRNHARVSWDGERWLLEDLGSRYGTRLEGEDLAGPTPLAAGARLQFGRLDLRAGEFGEAAPELQATDESPALPRQERDRRYELLLDIMEILAGERSISEILAAVIRLAVSAAQADRGFILLYDAETGRWLPDSIAGWQRGAESDEEAFTRDAIGQVSQTVLREALESGRTVFLKYAATDPRYESAASIHMQEVQSLICCPLIYGKRKVGAFYIDRKHKGSDPFLPEDGELLETIAHQAARVLEKEQLLGEKARNEKLAMLGTMVGRITHELKNPLYNIRGTTENIIERLGADEPLPTDELRARLGRILSGLEKAEGRMRSLLRFARPTGGQRESLPISRVLTAAAVEAKPTMDTGGIKLERDYDKGPRVLADAEALEQVFSNLLFNAVQALTETDDPTVILSLETCNRLGGDEPDWVEVRVEDNGPGIAPENLDRIFEDFFTTRKGEGGSGLGLAICRHLVEEHRGILSAENRPEGGARFRVGLPLYSN